MMNMKNVPSGGVVWITGYSGSGKTTLGRIVCRKIEESGAQCILLDGDHLRAVFGDKFGYANEDRRELALAYMRLCSHLSAQGVVVILSAVAMFDEAHHWLKKYVPLSIQVYLNVPYDIRIIRDQNTKKIYTHCDIKNQEYDEPLFADLILDNCEESLLDYNARKIVDFYFQYLPNYDIGRSDHWDNYYSKKALTLDPSPFCLYVSDLLSERRTKILDVGCGNGRDSLYLNRIGHYVTGIDLSTEAISSLQSYTVSNLLENLEFFAEDAKSLLDKVGSEYFNVAYSRFVLHAMPLHEELFTIHSVSKLLKPLGDFFIECRSVNDPTARLGDIIGPNERIYGHYRRFIVAAELVSRLRSAGFEIISCEESNGFAKVAGDDPVLIRVHAKKA